MAVIAYASADAAPKINPYVDPEIDLSLVALPQIVQLFGDAFDSGDPGNLLWNWSWTILDDDPASASALSSAVVQNPTVTVPTWRNVRIFLIAQHAVTLEFSETDPLLAPETAFVTVRVRAADTLIQKPAAGERNYHDDLHEWADVIEGFGAGVGAHTITDHTDIVDATGAEVEAVTSGALAEVVPGIPLHLHGLDVVAQATTGGRGAVTLEEAGTGAGKVITRERVCLQGSADASRTSTAGLLVGQVVPATYEGDQIVNGGVPLVVWALEEDLTLTRWAVTLADGGQAAAAHPYRFRLGAASAANAATNTWTDLGVELTGSPGANNYPLILEGAVAYSAVAGDYLALICCAAPRIAADGELPGGGLNVQVFARREVA